MNRPAKSATIIAFLFSLLMVAGWESVAVGDLFVAPRRGGWAVDAALDSTGKVHGILPKLKDLAKYSRDDLEVLLPQLRSSVQKRIETTVTLGADYCHNARLAEEQALIKSIEKLLGL